MHSIKTQCIPSGSLETRLCNGGVESPPHHNTMLSISYLIFPHNREPRADFRISVAGETSNTLERPRAADAVAAADDAAGADTDAADEGDADPSVNEVAAPRPRDREPTSPTPPPAPASQRRLNEIVADRTARGEPPGTADEDHLTQGRKESDEEDNEQALASQSARGGGARKRTRKSDAEIETNSDEDLSAPRRERKAAKARKRQRSPSPSTSSDSAEHRSGTSRHRPVTNSAIYNTYANEGQILAEVRKRFQTLVFVRDGSPPKTLTVYRHLNFKAVLQAAKDVMTATMNKQFKTVMDNAYKDTSKE